MSYCVCAGALMSCPFGMATMPLNVLPTAATVITGHVATVNDNVPFVNIPPFGMCQSYANPTVAAATAAAMGVLTPMPCVPVISAPWSPGSPTVQIGGKTALTESSQVVCAWGGVIRISIPGQFTVMVP